MSRTNKKKITSPQPWRNAKSHKLTPYLADKDTGEAKHHPTVRTDRYGQKIKITKTEKLITKNANRSLKKAARQQSKQEIREALDQ